MPQPIAQRIETPPIVPRERLVISVEVRHIGERRIETQLLRLGDRIAARVFQVTEIQRERQLRFVGQMLVAKHQHGVAIHARLDRCAFVARDRSRDVHAGHLAREFRHDPADTRSS